MKVAPKRKRKRTQGTLFDKGIASLGQARFLIGEFFEELCVEMFDVYRLQCSTLYDICPDVQFKEKCIACKKVLEEDHNSFQCHDCQRLWSKIFYQRKHYGECKGSGLNNQIILYEERCRRYDRFHEENDASTAYIIFSHDVKCVEMENISDLQLLRERLKEVIVVDSASVHKVAYQKPTRRVNGKASNPKYHTGWTIQISEIKETCDYDTYQIQTHQLPKKIISSNSKSE